MRTETMSPSARDRWLAAARSEVIVAHTTEVTPVAWGEIQPNTAGYQGFGFVAEQASGGAVPVVAGECVVFDLGTHHVGHLELVSDRPGVEWLVEPAEVAAELGDRWEDHPAVFGDGTRPVRDWAPVLGQSDRAGRCRFTKRMACRYLRVTPTRGPGGGPVGEPVRLLRVAFRETSSAPPLVDAGAEDAIDTRWSAIDAVAVRTLRNCMHEVFEDGPKRDRRLWLGDLRLQALADAVVFRQFSLVRRCLHLLAGCVRDDGLLPASIYLKPSPRPTAFIPDYAMLFAPTLLDYARHSGDWATARDLYPLAASQVSLIVARYFDDGLASFPDDVWCFIDWSEPLDRQAAEQATAVYASRALADLASGLGLPEDEKRHQSHADRLGRVAREKLWDRRLGLFVSGPGRQLSVASQVWMILAGVVDPEAGRDLLRRMGSHREIVQPGCPYLMHHLVDAHVACGQHDAAGALVEAYWGDMVRRGADTFWEVHDPEDERRSPYQSHLFNSYCHAWSCTPTLFIRKGQLRGPGARRERCLEATA